MKPTPIEALQMIAADMQADAINFNGREFNGRNVAEYLGNLGAAIAAIAIILQKHLEDAEQ